MMAFGFTHQSIYRLARVPTYLLLARLILVDNQHQLHLCKVCKVSHIGF